MRLDPQVYADDSLLTRVLATAFNQIRTIPDAKNLATTAACGFAKILNWICSAHTDGTKLLTFYLNSLINLLTHRISIPRIHSNWRAYLALGTQSSFLIFASEQEK